MFEINCINLKERTDRIEHIYKNFPDEKYFKINRFNAIKNINGHLGCLCSHLQVIKENIDKPYIIIIEDDLLLRDTIENIYNIIKIAIENISKWVIFNASPSFWSFKQDKKLINSRIENTPFINLNWGQTTSFMIYSPKCYDKIIALLENEKLNFKKPIDLITSENFVQTTYMYGYLVTQIEDWSDTENKHRTDLKNYFTNQEKMLMNKTTDCIIDKTIDYKIGIYSIFIGEYTIYYEEFIKSINKLFFPGVEKKIFIITNKDLQSYDNTYILKISDEYIDLPFLTLFRFKYFKQIPLTELKTIDYMFFLNGNSLISKSINFCDLPLNKHIFTLHDGFYASDYNNMPFEKNKDSSAYIPFDDKTKYTYVGGRFFGACLVHFIEMCNTLYMKILDDLKNNYIAIWHDESHLNHYFYEYKLNNYDYFMAGIEYHVPEEQQNRTDFKSKKIVYLDKRKKITSYPINWNIKKVKYIYNAGVEITNDLIHFYQN